MSIRQTSLSAQDAFLLQREKAKSVFSSINRYRASKNIPTLTWDNGLYSYCVLHNIDMHSSSLKTSRFTLGQEYNENVAQAPGGGQLLDIWRAKEKERENILNEAVRYSAISLYGDDHEFLATMIFTETRPRKDNMVHSMKTVRDSSTWKSKDTKASKGMSSVRRRTASAASTNIRYKSTRSSAKTDATSKHPSAKGRLSMIGTSSDKSMLKKIGQTIGKSFHAGVKTLGEALDSALPSESHACPQSCVARHSMYRSSMPRDRSRPYTHDKCTRACASATRQSILRSELGRRSTCGSVCDCDESIGWRTHCGMCRIRNETQCRTCTRDCRMCSSNDCCEYS